MAVPSMPRLLVYLFILSALIVSIRIFIILSCSLHALEVAGESENSGKPTLILHVGPKKTGTTSIQQGLLKEKRNARYLQKDGIYSIPFDFPFVASVVYNCLKAGNCNKTSWEDLTHQYTDAIFRSKKEGVEARAVVQSNEALSCIPTDKATKERFAQLQEFWNVKVIVVYRRLDEWLPSFYAEHNKRLIFDRRKNRPTTWKNALTKRSVHTFPHFFIKDVYNDPTDSLATLDRFQSIYGRENVLILDMSSPNGLEVEFACRGLPEAGHTCQWAWHTHQQAIANDISRVHNPTAGQFPFDHDILVVEAGVNQRLFDIHVLGRVDSRNRLQERLEAWNMSIHDLPQTCLSQEQQDWVWNRTLTAERLMADNPMQESDLWERFLRNRRKFCSVDAIQVLKNDTWRGFFQSLAPAKEEV